MADLNAILKNKMGLSVEQAKKRLRRKPQSTILEKSVRCPRRAAEGEKRGGIQ